MLSSSGSFSSSALFEQTRSAAFRTPRRISITIPWELYETLVTRSNREGRSLSNLAAFVLEHSCAHDQQSPPRFQ
ncbi:MAG: hypothetical protein VKM98_07615 [Cyanobacteriota bacterium]|nr:hypothetical protein [Cyanobacteriota bacterium]